MKGNIDPSPTREQINAMEEELGKKIVHIKPGQSIGLGRKVKKEVYDNIRDYNFKNPTNNELISYDELISE